MHNRLMSNVEPFFFFFFSDLSQFLHVGFVLVNKHCPVFFSVTTSDKLHAISAIHPNLGTYGKTNEDEINIKLENIPSHLFQILSYSPSHSNRAYLDKIHLLEDSQVCVTLPTF